MSRTPSLDLAVIGNSALAALIDREGRMVWCCWPGLDGDPIFCALIDGDQEERGLFVDRSRRKLHQRADLCAQHRDPAHHDHHPFRRLFRHRFRAAVPRLRAHVPPADDHSPGAADLRALPRSRAAEAHARLRRERAQYRPGLQPYQLRERGRRVPRHHGRAGQLRPQRQRLRAGAAADLHPARRRDPARRRRPHRRRLRRSARANTGRAGCALSTCPSTIRRR